MEVFQGGVKVGEEFSGTGDEGDFGGFAIGAQAQVEGLQGRGFFPDGAQGGHVEGAAQLVATALNKAHSAFFPAVFGKGGQATEGGDLFAVQLAELRQLEHQSSCGDLADAELGE